MNMHLLLLVFAFVLFVLAAIPFTPTEPYWNRLCAAGLACWVAASLFG
jgi:hypothetical protein